MVKQIYCVESTTCNKYPLEQRKIIKRIIQHGFFNLAVLGFMFILVLRMLPDEEKAYTLGPLILILILLPYNIVFSILYLRFYFYDLKEDRIIIRKGVISRREITLYYNKVQNVFVDQDWLDRLFGLYDVHIATADFQSSMAHIDGVNKENSEIIKNIILEKIKRPGDGL